MSVYEMALKYYPQYWDEARLRKLVEAGKLTGEEFEKATGKPYEEANNG